MNTLFVIGVCIRLIGFDAWQQPTHKINQVGKNTYLTEYATQTSYGWSFGGDQILFIGNIENQYEVVTCPLINWNTK